MKGIYLIPNVLHIDKYMELCKIDHVNFEYNDFYNPIFLSDESQVKKRIDFYKKLDRDRSLDTMHGAFYDINIASEDPQIRMVSEMRVRQSLSIGRELGIKAVVFHTNYITNLLSEKYRNSWIFANKLFWKDVLCEFEELEIYMENSFDPDPVLLKRLAIEMSDESRFGVCLDLSHAFISQTPIAIWVKELAPFVRHIHMNDNDGKQDLHMPVGRGIFPWENYNDFIYQSGEDTSILIEVSRVTDVSESITFMKAQKLFPYDR